MCTQTHVHKHEHTLTYTNAHTHSHTQMCTHTHVHKRANTLTYTNVRTHTHRHEPTSACCVWLSTEERAWPKNTAHTKATYRHKKAPTHTHTHTHAQSLHHCRKKQVFCQVDPNMNLPHTHTHEEHTRTLADIQLCTHCRPLQDDGSSGRPDTPDPQIRHPGRRVQRGACNNNKCVRVFEVRVRNHREIYLGNSLSCVWWR